MLNASNNYTARIDGNPDYEYMKLEIRLIDEEIFIVHYDTGYWVFHQLTDDYIHQLGDHPTRPLAMLIWENYQKVVQAIWNVNNHGDNYMEEISKGFTISRH